MPVQIYAYPEDLSAAKADFANTDSLLSFFSRTLCEYPFLDEKFGYAEVEGDLTMENQTICSIQKNMICGDRRFELTFAHEMVHHWFGDLITPIDWHHTWLNEGFATYCEALYLEHREGHAAYTRHIKSMMSMPPGTYAGSVIGKSDTSFWDSFDTRVYYKGALVLHMLRSMLGDSLFFTALRNYINDPRLRYANARTEDFIRKCEDACGQDLSWFFKQWLYASADSIDRPEIQYSWNIRGAIESYTASLTIDQINAPRLLYQLPLDIRIIGTDSSTRTVKIVDSLQTQTFKIDVAIKPEKIIIDPDNKIFMTLRQKEGK